MSGIKEDDVLADIIESEDIEETEETQETDKTEDIEEPEEPKEEAVFRPRPQVVLTQYPAGDLQSVNDGNGPERTQIPSYSDIRNMPDPFGRPGGPYLDAATLMQAEVNRAAKEGREPDFSAENLDPALAEKLARKAELEAELARLV